MFDESDTISRLQSSTVRAALIAIIINVLTVIAVFTGKAFDITAIQASLESGYGMAINALSIYFAWKAFTGRVSADKKIEPLPWLEEAKTLIKKE